MSKMRKRRFTILTQGGAPAPPYKINTIMKANTILTRTNTYIEVESYKGEKRRIHLPKTIAKEAIYIVRGKIRMGEYQYNPKTDTWEKISRILLFLQSIVEAIRNIFTNK
jgi:hypothetical protein